ncbi:MAG: hypothetical protein ACXAEU_02600 [Candidatus Hodarchaeales archaeon]|jgi:ribosomal protein S25
MSVDFERKSRKKRRWGRIIEYSTYQRRLVYGAKYNDIVGAIEKALKKDNVVITPQSIAEQHDIRVSVAKQILKELEEKGKAKLVDSCSRIRIYTSP